MEFATLRTNIIGWDIGGAHIKAALLDKTGVIAQVVQKPCPLWQGIHQISCTLQQMPQFFTQPCVHAVTMTGEMADCFANKEQGVTAIIAELRKYTQGSRLLIYAGTCGLLEVQQVQQQHYQHIAAANWLASATFVASKCRGLFVDIGSTTSDILPLADGKAQALGFSDYQRLLANELVYSGVTRTPITALTHQVSFGGQKIRLMAEYFANSADIYRLTEELLPHHDQMPAADGGDKTILASGRRLARMLGLDFTAPDLPAMQNLAQQISAAQLQIILAACQTQLARQLLATTDCLIGAGIGRFLTKQIAATLHRPYLDFADLVATSAKYREATSDYCTAVALSHLARLHLQ